MSKALNLDAVKAALCKKSFEYFVKCFWEQVPGAQKVKWNWHMSYLCQLLQDAAEDVFADRPRKHDIVVNISPGTSKSTICSILYPAWIWCRMPNARILTASHTDELVLDLSNKSRHVIKSPEYQKFFPDVKFRSDQDTKGYFGNTKGGDRHTCTVSGKSPTGFHAHFLIVDDPIDPKRATSEVELKVAQDFFDQTFSSRKVDKEVAVTFLIMQRLHPLDPTGHLLKKSGREGAASVKHVKLPAELPLKEDGSYDTSVVLPAELGKMYVDGLMDPLRLTRKALKERQTDGQFAYAGQYLQEPIALGGGMFKSEYFSQRVKAAPYACRRVRYWDRASTEGGGARTAGVLLAIDAQKRIYVEHVVAGQWEPSRRNAVMKATALRDRARYGPRYEPVVWIEREGGSSGKDAFQAIVRLLTGFHVKEHNIMGMGKKEVRADPWSAQLAAGNVWLVDNGESENNGKAEWDIDNYVEEHLSFPVGRFLDQVDASSGGLAVITQMPDQVPVRVIGFANSKNKSPNLIVCQKDNTPETLADAGPALLVRLSDPEPNVFQEPELQLGDIIDSVSLQFVDIHPEEVQETWSDTLEPYNKRPEELVIQREHAKKLWAFLLKRRDRNPTTIILVCDGSRKARSIAKGIREVLNLPTKVNLPGTSGYSTVENQYIVDVVRMNRHSVVG